MSDILVVKSLFLMCDVSVVYCYTKSEKISQFEIKFIETSCRSVKQYLRTRLEQELIS